MSVRTRLAGFAALLAGVFGLATLAGGVVHDRGEVNCGTGEMSGSGDAMPGMAMAGQGLAVADGGYRLVVPGVTFAAGHQTTLRFRIVDSAQRPVRRFCDDHGARLHLIIVRRDLTGFQHLHPREAADGTWSIPVRLPAPGPYRMFTDFGTPGGHASVLGEDLFVPGDFQPVGLSPSSSIAAADGYTVSLKSAAVHPSGDTDLRFVVIQDSREVIAMQPYLGARGHLVALREGDLAYLHVHPQGGAAPGSGITFHAQFPTVGRYRLYLQFKHAGAVHTAEFTLEVRQP